MWYIPAILLAYLSGAVPYGYLITKHYAGINIREHGSGNTGSTNVKRIAGAKFALFTQLCDMAKGLAPVALVWALQHLQYIQDANLLLWVALATIAGHNFSIFLRFRGGKGVNTTLGASLFISPVPVLSAVVIYYLVKWRTGYVSVGSICLALSMPMIEFLLHGSGTTFVYFITSAILIVLMHIPNIKRLLNGTENR